MVISLICIDSVELGSGVPSEIADEFLEDFTTQIVPQIPRTTLLTTTLLEQKTDAKFAIGLGIFGAIIASTAVIVFICICVICVSRRKQSKR